MQNYEQANSKERETNADQSVVHGISPEWVPNLMHNLPGMAYRCKNDSDWTMLFLSEGSLELTGYNANELLNNRLLGYDAIIVEEDRDLVRKAIDAAVGRRTQFQIEYRITSKTGITKWVWEKGNAVYDMQNEPVYLDGFITDVSARRKAEDELKKQPKIWWSSTPPRIAFFPSWRTTCRIPFTPSSHSQNLLPKTSRAFTSGRSKMPCCR